MIENQLLHYGYLFIFLGTIFEGDATLLTAAFLAHQGYFRLSWVLVVAALSTLLASQTYYLIARRKGVKVLETLSESGPTLERIVAWSRKHSGLLMAASRFTIGFRTLIPVACGATGMRPMDFFLWNTGGAALWAAIFGFAGYQGGHVLTILVSDIRHHEKLFAAVLALCIAGFILWKTHGRELFDAWSLRRSPPKH